MNSTELLNEIKKELELLKHKGYDKRSFKSGYLLGYAKALQLQQTGVMVSSLRSNFAKSREQSVKVAEINAIRHCLELYANFEVDEEVIQKAVERYRGRN